MIHNLLHSLVTVWSVHHQQSRTEAVHFAEEEQIDSKDILFGLNPRITSLSYTLKRLLLSLFFYIKCFYCRGLPLTLFKQGKRRKESSRVEQAIEWRDVGDALLKKSDQPLCKCLHSYTNLSLSLSSRLVRSRVAKPVIYHLRVTACDNNYAFDNILVNLFFSSFFFSFLDFISIRRIVLVFIE